MRRALCTAALAAAALTALALSDSPATAAPAATAPTAGGATTRHQAEQLFRAGERAFKANQFDMAAQLFEQAYSVLPLPAIAFSAAQAYRLQYAVDQDARKLKRAVDLYQTYVDKSPKGNRVGDAARNLAELRPLLAQAESKSGAIAAMPVVTAATRLMVNTTEDVPGARASIDGAAPEPLPLMREVKPGRYHIRITAPGYFPFDAQREVVAGQTRPVEADLKPRPALVSIATADGAEVAVDGRPVGVTPLLRPLELSAGTHLLTVSLRGHRSLSREITVKRGERRGVDAPLERTTQRRVSYWVLGTSAALFVGAGVTAGLAIKAGSDADSLEHKRETEGLSGSELVAYQGDVNRHNDRVRDTWILLGVGGAVATAGALLYFMDNPRPDSPEAAARGTGRPTGGEQASARRWIWTPTAAPDGSSVGLALAGWF